MKNIVSKLKLYSCFCAPMVVATPLLCSSFLSCSTKNVPTESTINLFNTQQNIHSHSFTIPFNISSLPLSPVSVKVVNDKSQKISILRQQVFLDSTTSKIDFEISAMVDSDAHFNFGLEFYLINSSHLYQKLVFDNINIYYLNDPIDPVDEVVSPNKSISKVNEHDFEFRIQFYKQPTSPTIFVHLLDDVTQSIEWEDGFYDFKKEPGYEIYYIDVPIRLSLSEARTSSHPFSLQVNFLNSFGVEQTTIVPNFNAFFISEPTETIPSDYYNIITETVDGEEHRILTGLKPEISGDEAERYSVMILPDNVTDIAPGAFIDNRWFLKIDYLKIGANVQSIGEAAFVGCTQLFEIDISDCNFLAWLDEDTLIFNQLEYEDGFVWFDDTADIKQCLQSLAKRGLYSSWQGCRKSKIIPDSFYEFDKDDSNKLIGIHEEQIFQLHKYEIVRLPRHTTIVSPGALDALSTHPYKPSQTSPDIALRNFLMGAQIKELHSIPKGVTGNITFRCTSLKKIDDNLLSDISRYTDHVLPFGTINVDIKRLHYLEEIGASSFTDSNIRGTIIIPSSVKKIGEYAFGGCGISKLVLGSPIKQTETPDENLGGGAFSSLVKTTELDFSVYTLPPAWLNKSESDPPMFDVMWNAIDAVFYVNKNTSDEDLNVWKQKLYDHGAPILGVVTQTLEHYWTVVRRKY